MKDKEKIEKYWKRFLAATNRVKDVDYLDCFYFGVTEPVANALADLVLSGVKTATTSCLPSYEINNSKLPAIGDFSIVTDWNGMPKCVIETTCVTIIPFKDVTFDICKREGEDDNLQSWRDTHFTLFEAEGKKEGYLFTFDTLVVFEDFKVIYQ